MKGVAAMWGLLEWSQSAFSRRYGLRVIDVGSLRKGGRRFGSGSRELVYNHTSGHVSWSWRGQIL